MEQIKISKKMSEYVENIDQIEKILNQCEYDLEYIGKDSRNNQFKYILHINDIKFDYFEGIGNETLTAENKQNKILNAIWCLLSDRFCVRWADDAYDFICKYGYNNDAQALKRGHSIYHQILKNNEKLLKCFSEEQLDFLTDNIQL